MWKLLWAVGKGAGYEIGSFIGGELESDADGVVYRDIVAGIYIGVAYDVGSGNGKKVELEVVDEVDYKYGSSVDRGVKMELVWKLVAVYIEICTEVLVLKVIKMFMVK